MANLENLIFAARDGRVSRREFLSQATALGVTLVAATTMADRAALAETPKKGGRLKIGYIQASNTETFDQTKMTSNIDAVRAWGCYSGLARVTRGMEPEPMLAEEWGLQAGRQGMELQAARGRGIPQRQELRGRGRGCQHPTPRRAGLDLAG